MADETKSRSLLLSPAQSGAILSPCGTYRYTLWREWAPGPTVAFIGLNPSTADATQDDPTIRRCIGFAKREGAGRLVMVNLFAFRSTDPLKLLEVDDAKGPDNTAYLLREAWAAQIVIAAWGAWPAAQPQADAFRDALERSHVELHALGFTAGGCPRHPLYLRSDTPLVRWNR